MTLTIGRLSVEEVATWQQSGDGISISGVLNASTVEGAKVMRQQLSGYVDNPDEPVIPVTWDADDTVDGYYRVTGASVDTVPASLTAGWFRFSLSLQRVAGYASPLIENLITGAVRTNSHAITTAALSCVGTPSSAVVFHDTSSSAITGGSRTSETGAVTCTASADHERRQSFQILPADYYDGAAVIEVAGETVVGHQVPAELSDWRITNGLVRVILGATGFEVQCYDGAQWDTARVLGVSPDPSSAPVTITSPLLAPLVVLRNSPECVSVRLTVEVTSISVPAGEGFDGVVDLTLRRGDRMIRGHVAGTYPLTWGLLDVGVNAATALTGGIRRTSNDGGGNRWVFATPATMTNDLANGATELTVAAETFSFGFGFEVGGSGASGIDTAQAMVNQYHAAGSERQIVAAR